MNKYSISGSILLGIGAFYFIMLAFTIIVAVPIYVELLGEESLSDLYVQFMTTLTMSIPGIIFVIIGAFLFRKRKKSV